MPINKTITAFFVVSLLCKCYLGEAGILTAVVESWSSKLGAELWHFGETVTRRNKMQESFKDGKVNPKNGRALADRIALDIKNTMDLKISAVKRIMDTAENSAMASQAEGNVPLDYPYYNSKNLEPLTKVPGSNHYSKDDLNDPDKLILTPNSHFFNILVNTSVSAVHVPTNVYDRAPDVIHGIKWSANLDETFINNYKEDPSLSWQYFGSSTGFMRQYPAMKWEQNPAGPVDLYDCRTRSWFIEAATSPKDLLILVDNSGSMMGQRKEIARHVVNNILDTLGNNDFVNILTFVKDTTEIVSCFKDTLVQANLANIRELKMGMERMVKAHNIANFTVALTKAFELLQEYREEKLGAACNQAIMLITDGVPYNFKEIFEEYNWKKIPPMPVRVFTYLIGKEVADVREVKWMACANQGYYVHLSTMPEVREQVLQYVPVMARPMVLRKNDHPMIWTSVYADIIDPKMTDWLWDMKERAKQKEKSIIVRNKRKENVEEEVLQLELQHHSTSYDQESQYPYKMMTSFSMPVYDRRENATKVANLLGVAGTDFPNSDILRLMSPHLLGVNAYAFIVTNNGYILSHPDMRPVFQGILKPSYNNIDVTDVEIMDDKQAPREFSQELLKFRENLINQINGTFTSKVKYQYDGFKRVYRGRRHYYYCVITGTPFELVVALPDSLGVFDATLEIKRLNSVKGPKGVLEYFAGDSWKIHPEWYYCKYLYGDEHNFKTPEEELLHFLGRTGSKAWHWPLQKSSAPPEHRTNSSHKSGNSSKSETMDKNSYFCDRDLFLSLVYDAKATSWFMKENFTTTEEKGKEMRQRFGLLLVFVATRSGLTRWQSLTEKFDDTFTKQVSEENEPSNPTNIRAIDETWYKRAVEQSYIEKESFVYSVPFDAGDANDTIITATLAIFHTSSNQQNAYRAPVAVAGYQFLHSALHARFMNITSVCTGCEYTCADSSLDCFILDNNGYVIISEDKKYTGMFYGEVKDNVMHSLIMKGIYERVDIFDYQAVCFRSEKQDTSSSNKIFTSLNYICWFTNWIIGNVVWLAIQADIYGFIKNTLSFPIDEEAEGPMYPDTFDGNLEEPANIETNMKFSEKLITKMMITRTRPQPCDMQVGLYTLTTTESMMTNPDTENCDRPFVVFTLEHSNLIMLAVNKLCKSPDPLTTVQPSEISYNDTTLSCVKVMNKLPRRRPKDCIKSHPKEKEIKLCGKSSSVNVHILLASIPFLIAFY